MFEVGERIAKEAFTFDFNEDEEVEEKSVLSILAESIPLLDVCIEGGEELITYANDKYTGKASQINVGSASVKFGLGATALAIEALFATIIISQER